MEESMERKPLIVRTVCATTVPGLNVSFIPGENEVDKPDVMRVLLKWPGPVEFNAQDIVDLGWMSAEEVASYGYEVVNPVDPVDKKGKPKIVEAVGKPAAVKPPVEKPNYQMSMPEIEEWAQDNLVVLKLKGEEKWDHDQCVEACMERAREIQAEKDAAEVKTAEPAEIEPKAKKKPAKKKGK